MGCMSMRGLPVKNCGNKGEFVTALEETLEDCTQVSKHTQWHIKILGLKRHWNFSGFSLILAH